jgi:hypothetical protein
MMLMFVPLLILKFHRSVASGQSLFYASEEQFSCIPSSDSNAYSGAIESPTADYVAEDPASAPSQATPNRNGLPPLIRIHLL